MIISSFVLMIRVIVVSGIHPSPLDILYLLLTSIFRFVVAGVLRLADRDILKIFIFGVLL